MKNQYELKSIPALSINFRKKLFLPFLLFISSVFIISCRKEINETLSDEMITDANKVEAAAANNIYYLSPSGNDNNSGTISSPWLSLNKAWNSLAAGDILYLRGGNYLFTSMQYLQSKNGTSGNLIKIWAYPGETPVLTRNYTLNADNIDLIYFEGNYIHFKGLEIANSPQRSGEYPWSSFRAGFANNCIWENINYHHNAAGMQIKGNSSNNLILNSDFHHNADPFGSNGSGFEAYDGADGFAFNNVSGTNNTIRGCRSWWNADDGFDLWDNNGYVLIENCWAFWNGYIPGTFNTAGNGSGFKLGLTGAHTNTLLRTVQNCIAHKNRSFGIVENATDCKSNIFNNTVTNTGVFGFWFGVWNPCVATLKNNISYNDNNNQIAVQDILANNSWQGGLTATSADFVSTDDSQLTSARQSDGSLPIITFLHLATGSDLINSGSNVGLPYSGSLPDVGAFESGSTTAPPNQSPVANAGTDKAITLPVNSISLTGSGTDPDGTITAYQWTFRSGPNTPVLSGANTTTLAASSLVAGTYTFRLTVTDNGGLTAFDEVNVSVAVSTTTNQAPTANAGANKTITLPVNNISLTGSGTDPDGTITAYQWTFRSGPNTPVLSGANTTTLAASSLVAGTYTFRLTVTDNGGLTAFDEVNVSVAVSTTTNQAPVANAGADKTITLPVNSISLTGSGTDPDGTITAYQWTFRSGPNTPVLSGANTTTLTASNLIAGTYTFRLTVTDNGGLTAFDQVKVVVKPKASTNLINTSQAVQDAGFSYYVVQNFGVLPDINSNPTRSTLRIFENGIELKPPHSKHSDIQTLGRGRFSHWGDGTFIALYFSASDNTNPKTNGRTYTYTIN